MKKEALIILVMSIVILFSSSVSAQLADSPWPTFHGDSQRRGLSPYDTSHIDGTIKWVYEVNASIQGSPSIGEDGTIYIGIDDGYLYAFDPDGTIKWKTKIGTPLEKEYGGHVSYTSILSSPAIVKDGTIYISSRDQFLFAITSEGKEKWRFPLNFTFDNWVAPAIGEDGTIYMTSSPPKGGIYAINPDGIEKWHYTVEERMFNSVSIGKDGTIYFASPVGSKTNKLFAFNQNGDIKWEVETELFMESTPTVADDGTVYVGSFAKESDLNAGIYAIKNGEIKWYFETKESGEVMSTPAIGKDNTIYFGADDGNLYALNPDGTEKWHYSTTGLIESSPVIGDDGTIYFGVSTVPEGNPSFFALNPDGTLKWHNFNNSNSIISSPTIGADGTIYVGSYGGVFYAFGKPADGKGVVEENIDSLRHNNFWNPEAEGIDCFNPESKEIEEKCDEFCYDNPEFCLGYWEWKESSNGQFEKKELNFFQIFFYWIKNIFR